LNYARIWLSSLPQVCAFGLTKIKKSKENPFDFSKPDGKDRKIFEKNRF